MSTQFGKGCHLHLIDGSAFIFRAYHALPPLTRKSDGLPVGAVAGFCNMLQRYVDGNNGADAATHVAVHDAARPCVTAAMIQRVLDAAESLPAVIPAVAVSSTLKRVEAGGAVPPEADPLDAILGVESNPTAGAQRVIETVPREGLVAVQTPQVFDVDLLRRAYASIEGTSAVTDDAGLVEALGEAVHVVEGDPGNLKITQPGDAELCEALLAHRKQTGAKERAVTELFGDDDED